MGDLISLSDMYQAIGKNLNKKNPLDWAAMNGASVLGDAVETFSNSSVALSYALYLSPGLFDELSNFIDGQASPAPACNDEALIKLSGQSRQSFNQVIRHLGFSSPSDFYKFTNHLYSKVLTSNVNSLRVQLMLNPTESIRKHLDAESLALVVTAETLFVCHAPGLVNLSESQLLKVISECAEAAKRSRSIQVGALH